MIYLLLAILSSAVITIIMRAGQKWVKDDIAMFIGNYIICTLLSLIYMKGSSPFKIVNGSNLAIGMGVLGGILFLLSFVLLKLNITQNGIIMATTFMKLGVLVPTLMAIIIFHDSPKISQLGGFVVALLAILIINGIGTKPAAKSSSAWLLVILLLSGGFTDSLANIYDKAGTTEAKDQYLFFIFLVAALLCLITLIIKKRVPTLKELALGAIVGIPNYYSTRFLLLALSKLPAIVVYPVFNIATIFVVSLVGIVAFKEKLSKRKWIGMALIALALLLLNL